MQYRFRIARIKFIGTHTSNTTQLTRRQSIIIKPIRNDDELKAAFQRLEMIFQAEPDTPEADEMEYLVTLIENYENKHYALAFINNTED